MLLQQIVEKLDSELERLLLLREIVAGLRGISATLAPLVEVAQAARAEPVAVSVEVKRLPPRAPRESGRKQRKSFTEKPHTALTSAIPARPVVVTADALAKETAAKHQARTVEPKAPEGTLGAMIRAMQQQGAM